MAALAALGALAVASCGGDGAGPDPDTPAALVIHSGDGQTARTGTEAGEPVRVRVTAQSGTGVSGVAVSFEVAAGGGSVPSSTALSDANGIASPGRWTMGAPGPQELRASVAGLGEVVFHATALGIPAEIAAVAGAGQEARVATAVPVAPEVVVTDASGAALSNIAVVFATEMGATVANAEVLTNAQGRANPGAWTLGSAVGAYSLFARIEGEDAEDVQGNPVRFEAVALPGPAARMVAVAGDGQESETTLPVPVAPRVRVEDAYGNAAEGVRVGFTASADSEVTPREATTDAAGIAAVDKWILGTTAGTTYRLTASVTDAGGAADPVVFGATATEAVYNIEVVHVTSSLVTDAQRGVFERAEAIWERAITGNLAWSTTRKPSLETDCLAKSGIGHNVVGDRVVDDLLIYAQIREIDGPGGVIAGAGPCLIRENNSLPVVGIMFFDRADMSGDHVEGTVLHEMAHVIGFGTLWEHLGLLRNPASGIGGQDTHFEGAETAEAFRAVGGDRYTGGSPVPVQHQGGEGVWNGHWREFVFRSELMTPFPDAGANPLSVVSLASMVDIGYEGVDYGVAEDFVLPLAPSHVRGEGEMGRHGHAGHGAAAELSDDIVRIPLVVVDRDGQVVRVIPPE